jgi:endo-1,4-beta-xylanase
VTVRDTTPPSAPLLTVTPDVLSPANHKMARITVTAQSTDTVSAVVCAIQDVSSSEPDNGLGDGDTANDIGPASGLTTSLRAERSGAGNGRLYTITVGCSDRAGNTSSSTVGVTVPKNR